MSGGQQDCHQDCQQDCVKEEVVVTCTPVVTLSTVTGNQQVILKASLHRI